MKARMLAIFLRANSLFERILPQRHEFAADGI
jgi:hypothetical protein